LRQIQGDQRHARRRQPNINQIHYIISHPATRHGYADRSHQHESYG
jgi:hypothetical protein